MKRIIISLVLPALLLLPASCSFQHRDYSRVFQKIYIETDKYSDAYRNLEHLCTHIGPRMTGTLSGTMAEELAYMKFKSYGFDDVFFQSFHFNRWDRGPMSLEWGPDSKHLDSIPSLALAYSPTSDIAGNIVDVGNGLIDDYNNIDVNGKIVLLYLGILPNSPEWSRNVHRSEKISIAAAQGAIGAITINNRPGGLLLTGTASLGNDLTLIPAVNVSFENGMALKDSLQKASTPYFCHIKMENGFERATGRNVVARLKGQSLANETIVLGAHLDSWDISQGAVDNGTGIVSVIDIARLLKSGNLPLKRSIDFVLFGAEEVGHFGSNTYVEEARKNGEINSIRYMYNMDMPGNTYGFNLMCRYESEDYFKEIGSLIQQTDTCFTNVLRNYSFLHSDHAPFMAQGIPCFTGLCDLGKYDAYHTPDDNMHWVNETLLKRNIRTGAMILYALANEEKLPANKLGEEDTKNYFIQNNLKDQMILSGTWLWD